jgi:hypothetical protein
MAEFETSSRLAASATVSNGRPKSSPNSTNRAAHPRSLSLGPLPWRGLWLPCWVSESASRAGEPLPPLRHPTQGATLLSLHVLGAGGLQRLHRSPLSSYSSEAIQLSRISRSTSDASWRPLPRSVANSIAAR